jgi:hypothetical protein
VLGYHGCDRGVAESVLAGASFKVSENQYDWLGSGAYFWEANPIRGLEFAEEFRNWRKGMGAEILEPYVIGAVIDLGFCLDLISSAGLKAVGALHEDFLAHCKTANIQVPTNSGGPDLLFRRLDCAVINHLNRTYEKSGLPGFDTVRGVFVEGKRLYPDAGFFEKTHIQICVRNLACIKGVFRVPEDQLRV